MFEEIDEMASSTESVKSSFEINESINSNKSLDKPSRWAADEKFTESITRQQPFLINIQKEENVTPDWIASVSYDVVDTTKEKRASNKGYCQNQYFSPALNYNVHIII